MIHLRPLGPSTLGELAQHLTRTPGAPPWVEEVEDFVLRWGPAAVFRAKAGQVLLIDDDGTVIGAAVHRPHTLPGAQLLAAVLLDRRYRGQGRGEDVLRASVQAAHDESGKSHVMWLVHQDNGHMLHLSAKVCEYVMTDGDHQVFAHDR